MQRDAVMQQGRALCELDHLKKKQHIIRYSLANCLARIKHEGHRSGGRLWVVGGIIQVRMMANRTIPV